MMQLIDPFSSSPTASSDPIPKLDIVNVASAPAYDSIITRHSSASSTSSTSSSHTSSSTTAAAVVRKGSIISTSESTTSSLSTIDLNMADMTVIKARLLAALFIFAALLFLHLMISTWTEIPIQHALSQLLSSPWSITIVIDFFIGALFCSVYLWLLNGPSLCCLPGRLWALMIPFLGNIILMAYVSSLLLFNNNEQHRGITSTLLPGTGGIVHHVRQRGTGVKVVTVTFTAALVAFVGVYGWAWSFQSPSEGWNVIAAQRWTLVTFADNGVGLLFFVVYVILREETYWFSQVLWVLSVVLFGHATICVYVLGVARMAWINQMEFRKWLLSQRMVLGLEMAEETMQLP